MFSSRLPAALAPNAISRAVARLRAERVPLIDLTETNPTAVGLEYGADVMDAFARVDGRRYSPEPAGLLRAREASVSSSVGFSFFGSDAAS